MSNELTTNLDQLGVEVERFRQMADEAAWNAWNYVHEAGRRLIAAKEALPRGQFEPWLVEHFHGTLRLAEQYMQVSRGWSLIEEKRNGVSGLSFREALKLTQTPKPEKPALDHDEGAKRSEPAPRHPPVPAQAPTSASEHLVATLEQDVEEWREKAVQAERERDAVQVANDGADVAAKRIVALEQENAALKQDVARLQEEVGRWKHKCKQLAGAKN